MSNSGRVSSGDAENTGWVAGGLLQRGEPQRRTASKVDKKPHVTCRGRVIVGTAHVGCPASSVAVGGKDQSWRFSGTIRVPSEDRRSTMRQ